MDCFHASVENHGFITRFSVMLGHRMLSSSIILKGHDENDSGNQIEVSNSNIYSTHRQRLREGSTTTASLIRDCTDTKNT